MVNEDQLRILQQGVDAWNKWRVENPGKAIDLNNANLSRLDLSGADFRDANLCAVNFSESDLSDAKLQGADLSAASLIRSILDGAHLTKANLVGAILFKSSLRGANLYKASLYRADLTGADLSSADLSRCNLAYAILVDVDLNGANVTDCYIYGISAWGLNLCNAKQRNLVITHTSEPTITVDNLEVAQFIYLLLHNEKIRHVIDTITSKVVLILGRFSEERKAVLDAIKDELSKRDYLPVIFDFKEPASRDLTETISVLVGMARFIIVDITDPKSVPAELEHVVPGFPSVPVMPLIQCSESEYALFKSLRRRCPWVLEPYRYEDQVKLLASLSEKVVGPAEAKVKEIMPSGRQ